MATPLSFPGGSWARMAGASSKAKERLLRNKISRIEPMNHFTGRAALLRRLVKRVILRLAAQERRPTFRFIGSLQANGARIGAMNLVHKAPLPNPLPIGWSEGKDEGASALDKFESIRLPKNFPSPHLMGRGAAFCLPQPQFTSRLLESVRSFFMCSVVLSWRPERVMVIPLNDRNALSWPQLEHRRQSAGRHRIGIDNSVLSSPRAARQCRCRRKFAGWEKPLD